MTGWPIFAQPRTEADSRVCWNEIDLNPNVCYFHRVATENPNRLSLEQKMKSAADSDSI
jgi:hypothetical protein